MFIVLLRYHEALLRQLQLVGHGVHVDNPHVEHAVRTLLPNVSDEKASLLLGIHYYPWLLVGYCNHNLI